MICSRDWQDMLDKFERLVVAVEALVQQGDDRAEAKALTKDVQANANALSDAIPK